MQVHCLKHCKINVLILPTTLVFRLCSDLLDSKIKKPITTFEEARRWLENLAVKLTRHTGEDLPPLEAYRRVIAPFNIHGSHWVCFFRL